MSHFGKNIKKIRTIKKLSQSAFADLFNLKRASIGAYEEGRAEAKIDTIIEIAKYFSISVDQLLAKELTMNEIIHFDLFKHQVDKNAGGITGLSGITIPYIPVILSKEYIVKSKEQDFIKQFPIISLPNLKKTNRAFEHEGMEMLSQNAGLHHGDILICEKQSLKKKNITLNKLYVVVTENSIIRRRLTSIEDNLIFSADNPDFEAIHLPFNSIFELWKVKGVYSISMKKTVSYEDRILKLESQIQQLINNAQ